MPLDVRNEAGEVLGRVAEADPERKVDALRQYAGRLGSSTGWLVAIRLFGDSALP